MSAADNLRWGCESPYDNIEAGTDPARRAVLGVLENLTGRRGIGHAFDDIDDEVRAEIVESLTAIVREAHAADMEKARAALEPFATALRLYRWPDHDDGASVRDDSGISLSLRDFRRAGAALDRLVQIQSVGSATLDGDHHAGR